MHKRPRSHDTPGATHVLTHMVRYTVKADQAAHHEQLVRAVFAELDGGAPTGLRYETFKLADGVTFVHLISHASTDGHGPPRLDALKALHAGLRERCDQEPVRTQLTEVGSYRRLDDSEP